MFDCDQSLEPKALQVLGSIGTLAVPSRVSSDGGSPPGVVYAQAEQTAADESKKWKGSALGSLYPFIKQEQQRTRQRLAYLTRRPKDLEAWKAETRTRVFDSLAYRPEPCQPRAVVLERVDKGEGSRVAYPPPPGRANPVLHDQRATRPA